MEPEKLRQQNRGIKNKTTRVMILGIPNVGKSSFINRIAKRNTAVVGNKPGVTKQKQWIRIGKNIELLDIDGTITNVEEEENSWEQKGNGLYDAKYVITEGMVKLNDNVVYERGKKCYDGDIIEFENEKVVVRNAH